MDSFRIAETLSRSSMSAVISRNAIARESEECAAPDSRATAPPGIATIFTFSAVASGIAQQLSSNTFTERLRLIHSFLQKTKPQTCMRSSKTTWLNPAN